jgi:thermitase
VSGRRKRGGKRRSALAAGVAAAAALALGTVGAAAAGVPNSADREAGPAAETVPGAVIVQWQQGADHAERVAARADAGVTYAAELGDPTFQLVETAAGESVAEAVEALEADPAVAVAEPDSLREVEALPNDPLLAQQWAIQNTGATVDGLAAKAGNDIDVLPAWERTVGTPSTVVADIDSGYRADSPDLGPVEWTNPGEIPGNGIDDDHDGYVDDVHGWDFVGENINAPTEDADPTDSNIISGGHGVHTAGIIGGAGNNGVGITGVAQNVRIMPLRVCSNEPASSETLCPTSAMIAAINYAGRNGARVANLSIGGTTRSPIEIDAYASNPGTLYLIAAANDGANNDSGESGAKGHHYPCDLRPAVESSIAGRIENTICVAALDPSEALASYSDYGATSVDLGAPGTAVLSTYPAEQTIFSDDFETNNFASTWSAIPGAVGFGRVNGEGPLTSAGITDSPGAKPAANQRYGVETTAGYPVPNGDGACQVEGKRYRKGGALGTEAEPSPAPYGVAVGGVFKKFFGGETPGSSLVSFHTVPILGLAGKSVQTFFEYHAGASPADSDGLWLDEVALKCNAPLSATPSWKYEDGTSMATPMVSGAAALLFSLDPGASVSQVRAALLAGAKPTASLAGKTVTGGRLDVAAAMNQLVPTGGGSPGGGSGGGEPGTQPPATSQEGQQSAASASPSGDPKSHSAPAGSSGCTVPKLAGKSLGQAKAALTAAGCKLGKVNSPKRKGGALAVRSSAPPAGAKASGAVSLNLGAKKKAKHRHH